jgi:hypothetical protein
VPESSLYSEHNWREVWLAPSSGGILAEFILAHTGLQGDGIECDMVLGPKARPIPALGNAQGRWLRYLKQGLKARPIRILFPES